MKAAQVDANGVVTNIILVESLDAFPGLVSGDGLNIGDRIVGGSVVPKPALIETPQAVPMLNLQLVLIDDGKLAAVESIIDSMTGDDGARARAYWYKALTARRDNYLVELMWPQLYATEAAFNDAWARAAALAP